LRIRDNILRPLGSVILVDPGNNPFTFAAIHDSITSNQSSPSSGDHHQWNKGIAFIFASLGITAPVLWMIILSHIWKPTRGTLILSGAAVGFLAGKAYIYIRGFLTRRKPDPAVAVEGPRQISRPASSTDFQYDTHGVIAFFIMWVWRRIAVVNLYSAI